jgi:xanthine/uracil permease
MITGSDPGAPDFANPTSLWIALVTVAVIVAGYRFLPPVARPLSVLVGIVVGTVVAAVAGRVDLSGVGGGPPVALPDLLHFGPPAFDVLASLSIAAIQIVLIVEVASQVNAVGEVVGKPVPDAALAAAVRADGVVTVLGGGVFQSFMYVTFTQNIGILSITKVYSRFVTATTGVFLVVLGFLPTMGQVVAAIPRPVLGAATLVMFGTIVVVGVQILGKVDFSSTADLVIAATALGVALVPRSIPGFYGHLPAQLAGLLGDGITVGIAVAFLLNLLFHHVPTRKGATS